MISRHALNVLSFALFLLFVAQPMAHAADLFESPAEKAGFLRALDSQNAQYDPAEKMIRRPYSSPGYHTTLKGGYVHPTRDSFNYAVALLDSGRNKDLARACDILRRTIALQDQDPDSRTYGIWSWFLEEPLDKMSPPDWNWADFCGVQLLQVLIDHIDRLPADLQQAVKDSIVHAARSIIRRNVGPGYTNIAIMGTYVTLVAGERLGIPDIRDYGRKNLRRFYDYTKEKGSFSEYNSPTYTVVAVEELTRMLAHVRDPESRRLAEQLNSFAWLHIARHFHAPTRQWAGPNSRAYHSFLRDSDYAFIQRATGDAVKFVGEDKLYGSTSAHRIRARCPAEFYHYFTDLPEPRMETETFVRETGDRHDLIGRTWMAPEFCIGTVNMGDLWNQRRPLLAYIKTPKGPVAMRVRCLHDDYDYSSASIFTVQDGPNVLAAITFATDRGDTHISLDRIKDGRIEACDLRIRIQLEGPIDQVKMPESFELNSPTAIRIANTTATLQIPCAVFDNEQIQTKITRGNNQAGLDTILYQGPKKTIDFKNIKQAALILTLTLSTNPEPPTPARIQITQNQITATWQKMTLKTPTTPTKTSTQKTNSDARLNEKNAWKH